MADRRALRQGLSIAILIFMVSSSDLSAESPTPDGLVLAQLDEGMWGSVAGGSECYSCTDHYR